MQRSAPDTAADTQRDCGDGSLLRRDEASGNPGVFFEVGAVRPDGHGVHDGANGDPIVLFDGVCNLCNGTVQFIIRRDRRGVFRFASLDSDAARRLLSAAGVDGPLLDSMVLIEAGRVYTRSTAVLRIFRRLRFPWPLLFVFIAIPRPIRNWVYYFVASRRYRWFGRRDARRAPTAELRSRILE